MGKDSQTEDRDWGKYLEPGDEVLSVARTEVAFPFVGDFSIPAMARHQKTGQAMVVITADVQTRDSDQPRQTHQFLMELADWITANPDQWASPFVQLLRDRAVGAQDETGGH